MNSTCKINKISKWTRSIITAHNENRSQSGWLNKSHTHDTTLFNSNHVAFKTLINHNEIAINNFKGKLNMYYFLSLNQNTQKKSWNKKKVKIFVFSNKKFGLVFESYKL